MIASSVSCSAVLGVAPDTITADSSNSSIGRWDSLGHINLCLALEEEFELSFDDRDVVAMTSYPAILDAVSRLKG